jgi:hypothetical protein
MTASNPLLKPVNTVQRRTYYSATTTAKHHNQLYFLFLNLSQQVEIMIFIKKYARQIDSQKLCAQVLPTSTDTIQHGPIIFNYQLNRKGRRIPGY